jgi:hypothetical protein
MIKKFNLAQCGDNEYIPNPDNPYEKIKLFLEKKKNDNLCFMYNWKGCFKKKT